MSHIMTEKEVAFKLDGICCYYGSSYPNHMNRMAKTIYYGISSSCSKKWFG